MKNLKLFLFISSMTLCATENAGANASARNVSTACAVVPGKNFQVSNESAPVAKSIIAVNPRNSNNLIVTGYTPKSKGTGTHADMFYYSLDGGQTWSMPDPPLLGRDGKRSNYPFGGDPVVLFSKGGKAYYIPYHGSHGFEPQRSRNYAWTSSDGGKTTSAPAFINDSMDHPVSAADWTDGPHGGNLYYFGWSGISLTEGYYLNFARTRDDATGWTVRRAVSASQIGVFQPKDYRTDQPAAFGIMNINNGILISRSGKLFIPLISWNSEGKRAYKNWLMTSDDGGETFSKPHRLTGIDGADLVDPVAQLAVAIDASDSPFRDRLYAVWSERSGPKNDGYLFLAWSTDGGKTWGTPRKMDFEGTPSDYANGAMERTLTVNDKGVLLLTAYRFEPGPWSINNKGEKNRPMKITRYAMASVNGGESFLSAVPIAPEPTQIISVMRSIEDRSNLERGQEKGNVIDFEAPGVGDKSYLKFHPGDWLNTVAGPGGTFHTQWGDGRTGVQQVWYASIDVLCNGKPALAHSK